MPRKRRYPPNRAMDRRKDSGSRMTLSEFIESSRALIEAATKEGWVYSEILQSKEEPSVEGVDVCAGVDEPVICSMSDEPEEDWRDNAKFIAESRQRLPLAIDCLEIALKTIEEFAWLDNPNEPKDVCSPASEYMTKARAALAEIERRLKE